MKIVATTSLPAVDRPNADRWNAACSCQNVMILCRSAEPYLGVNKLYSWSKSINCCKWYTSYLIMLFIQALFKAATYSVSDLIKTFYIRTIKADSERTFAFYPPLERFTLALLYLSKVRGISGQIQIISCGRNNGIEHLEDVIQLIQERSSKILWSTMRS